MHIFVEKEFLEKLYFEYDEIKSSEIKKIIYKIFTEYANIKWFCNLNEDNFESEIKKNILLTKLSDINLNYELVEDFEKYLEQNTANFQTLVFTQKTEKWFVKYEKTNILCFSYDNFEEKIYKFIQRTHKRLDLSIDEVNWNLFSYINLNTDRIIISDKYILNNINTIEGNILQLLNNIQGANIDYKIWIFTEIDDKTSQKAKDILENRLKNIKRISIINFIKSLSETNFHDRVLYTNYTLSTIGVGFDLNKKKKSNSEIICNSIFDKYTYRRLKSHIDDFNNYIATLEKTKTEEFKSNRFDFKNEYNLSFY